MPISLSHSLPNDKLTKVFGNDLRHKISPKFDQHPLDERTLLHMEKIINDWIFDQISYHTEIGITCNLIRPLDRDELPFFRFQLTKGNFTDSFTLTFG